MRASGRIAAVQDSPMPETAPRTGAAAITITRPTRVDARALLASPWLPWALQLVALVLWVTALPHVRVDAMTDLGLVSVLPARVFAALVLLALAMVAAVTAPTFRPATIAANVALFLVMVYALPALVEEAPRFSTTYVHLGFIETIERRLELFPQIDARFEWPVFFILAGYLRDVAGIADLAPLTPWVPLLSNVLYLGALAVLLRSFTTDARLRWLACWLFVATNWIGQDYLSPQGFNILLYLAIASLVVRFFRARAGDRGAVAAIRERLVRPAAARFGAVRRALRLRDDRRDAAAAVGRRTAAAPVANLPGLLLVVVLLYTISTASHQLTPFVILGGVTALVGFRRITPRGLPLLLGLILGAWLSYMATTYLAGHLPAIVRDIGRADAVATASVAERIAGSAEHQAVVWLRLLFSLGVWLLAALGVLRRLRTGRLDLSAILLAGVPFLALGLQSYGGEILLRVYLFALPFVAFLAAAAFRPRRGRWHPLDVGSLAAVAVALAILLPIARYGNERADAFTHAELAAAELLYARAEPGSTIVTVNHNAPIGYRDLERYQYMRVHDQVLDGDGAAVVDELHAVDSDVTYLFLSRGQLAYESLFYELDAGTWDDVFAEVAAHPGLELVHESTDARIYRMQLGEAGS